MSGSRSMVLTVCGLLVIGGPAFAQAVDDGGTPAPAAQSDPGVKSDTAGQAAQTAPRDLGHGTKAEAEHSAEATAHKSLNDPNNQLGTSLQGRTRPVVDADAKTTDAKTTDAKTQGDAQKDAAAASQDTPAMAAQATSPQAEAAPPASPSPPTSPAP